MGKTTTAKALQIDYEAFVVPEVNQLFERPVQASAEWYFERQLDRWRIAEKQRRLSSLVILDGDPFQPLWYNWAYDFKGWQNLDFMEKFYRSEMRDQTIRFPDLYVIFRASEMQLRERKEKDSMRARRGFENHLQMIEPQNRYFRAMQAFSPNQVLFLEAESIKANLEFIQNKAGDSIEQGGIESAGLFDKMIQWLRENQA